MLIRFSDDDTDNILDLAMIFGDDDPDVQVSISGSITLRCRIHDPVAAEARVRAILPHQQGYWRDMYGIEWVFKGMDEGDAVFRSVQVSRD
jgi:hypothetical protein